MLSLMWASREALTLGRFVRKFPRMLTFYLERYPQREISVEVSEVRFRGWIFY